MSRSSRESTELVAEALYHFEIALEHSQQDLTSSTVVDAIALRLASGIDTLNSLNAELRSKILGSQWLAMRGMRNRIAHGYMLVDPDIIRDTAVRDLPSVVEALRAWDGT